MFFAKPSVEKSAIILLTVKGGVVCSALNKAKHWTHNGCHGFCQNKKPAKTAPTYAPVFAALGAHRMHRVLLIMFLMFSPIVFGDESAWNVYLSENGWATISDTHLKGHSLSKAIGLVPKDVWLRSFRVFPSEKGALLQAELHDFLVLNYPNLIGEALNSAGNMHNPKVTALRVPFQEAIMASSLVTKLNILLQSRCERITSSSYEKFTISNNNGKPTYSAMVWLSMEKCT